MSLPAGPVVLTVVSCGWPAGVVWPPLKRFNTLLPADIKLVNGFAWFVNVLVVN